MCSETRRAQGLRRLRRDHVVLEEGVGGRIAVVSRNLRASGTEFARPPHCRRGGDAQRADLGRGKKRQAPNGGNGLSGDIRAVDRDHDPLKGRPAGHEHGDGRAVNELGGDRSNEGSLD